MSFNKRVLNLTRNHIFFASCLDDKIIMIWMLQRQENNNKLKNICEYCLLLIYNDIKLRKR